MIEIGKTLDRVQKSLDRITTELEYNQNHYMLIENYVEKYIPITIQEAITNNVRTFISREGQKQLDYYIKSRKKELHGVILDNDELPDVVYKMNSIRKDLGRILYPTRAHPSDAMNSEVQSSNYQHTNSIMSR